MKVRRRIKHECYTSDAMEEKLRRLAVAQFCGNVGRVHRLAQSAVALYIAEKGVEMNAYIPRFDLLKLEFINRRIDVSIKAEIDIDKLRRAYRKERGNKW